MPRKEKWAEETARRIASADPLRLGYAIGVFDGEGTVYRSCPQGKPNPATMRANMTDLEPLEALLEVFGGTLSGPYEKKHGGKPIWYWSLTGWTAVEVAYEAMRDVLSPRRCAQFERVLADAPPVALRGNSGGGSNHRNVRKIACLHGHALAGDNVYLWRGQRHCRQCRQEAMARFHAKAS